MAQDDYNIPNQSFPSFRSDLNSALSAINSSNSGTSRPSSAVAGTIWLDTTNGVTDYILKFFDGSEDINLANINTTANTVNFIDSSVASDLLNDTTPQLGGNLDVLAREILTSTTNGNIKLTPDGTGLVEIKGATNPGSIQLNCENNSHGIKLTSPAHSSGQSYELKFPTGNVTAGKFLKVASITGSGVTGVGQLSFDDAGGGTDWQSSIVTGTTLSALAGKGYWINTTSNVCTITLPGSPSVGDTIEFVDYARTWQTNNVTLNINSLKFQGGTTNPIYDVQGQSVRIVYSGATKGWIPTSDDDVTDEAVVPITANFLVLAGGGSGGEDNSGGGGAGGLRSSMTATGGGGSNETALTLVTGTQYTATVGAGYPASNGNPGSGANSSLSGSDITTITAVGGGECGSTTNYGGTSHNGQAGGCGGGGSSQSGGGAGGSGTANQGYAGGNYGGSGNHPGGGGGTGAVGVAGATGNSGNGGAGTSNSITGSAVTYGGGGGGGTWTGSAGTGGAGGGGAGSSTQGSAGQDGSANLGGGGGGGGNSDCSDISAGGSGVVILRVLTSQYTGTTTGSPTVTTDGSHKVIKFTGTGTYTA